jgi:hypothetical protein
VRGQEVVEVRLDASVVRSARDRIERVLLRRWNRAPRMQARRLDLRLDVATTPGLVRASADMTFVPKVAGTTMVCLIGQVKLNDVFWKDRRIKARVNSPYLVMSFPKRLEVDKPVQITLRYTYMPDEHHTIQQPITLEDCPERIWVTCRRPLLGLVQGRLLEGTEKPPHRTYLWEPPRSRRLSCLVADVRSFKKETPSGMNMWLHVQSQDTERAPRILDLCVQIYEESADSHHRRLPFADYHVFECDDPRMKPFNSPGLIAVPRGTFATGDKPTVYGMLAPEFNKEWRRDPTRLVSTGKAD